MKICIICHKALGVLLGGANGHIGGIERQTSSLAQWLASQGHETSIVTWDNSDPDLNSVNGVNIIKICGSDSGIPGLRFFHPRWTSLNTALAQADAELYYHNGAENATGQIALWCKRNHRPFVFSTAAETDVDTRLPELPLLRDRLLYKFGIRSANTIIAQTNEQRRRLKSGFDLDSVVLPMPCHLAMNGSGARFNDSNPRVVWVGRIDPIKRLE